MYSGTLKYKYIVFLWYVRIKKNQLIKKLTVIFNNFKLKHYIALKSK